MLIPASTAPTLRNHDRLIRPRKVVDQLARQIVVQQRAHRHLQGRHFARIARAVRSQPMSAPLRLVLRVEPEMHQRIVAQRRRHQDVAAMPPVPARRSAARNKLLPPEGHAPVPTIARFDPDSCFIDKHSGSFQSSATATMSHVLPSAQGACIHRLFIGCWHHILTPSATCDEPPRNAPSPQSDPARRVAEPLLGDPRCI